MFYTLMRKDLRLYRPAIVAALVVALFCEAIVPAISLWMRSQRLGPNEFTLSAPRVWREVQGGAIIAVALSCGLAAVFGCAAATVERRQRWAELAAMLPVSRARRTLARLATALTLAAAMVGGHLLLASHADHYGSRFSQLPRGQSEPYVAFAVGMFGLAWLAGAFLRSPAIAASAAIATVLGGFMLTMVIQDWQYQISGQPPGYERPYFVAMLIVGIVATVAGTIAESRRVEP